MIVCNYVCPFCHTPFNSRDAYRKCIISCAEQYIYKLNECMQDMRDEGLSISVEHSILDGTAYISLHRNDDENS